MTSWLGWRSPFAVVRAWHAMLDGTWMCHCARSAYFRDAITRQPAMLP